MKSDTHLTEHERYHINVMNELAKQLESETYFAKPYHSWERGLNAK